LQWLWGPPIRKGIRGIRYHQKPAHNQQWRSAFGCHGRASEPSGRHQVGAIPQIGQSPGLLRAQAEHAYPVAQAESSHRLGQELGSAMTGV
jgi:hypothetical protein